MSFICLLFTCFILPFLYQNAFISMADIFFSLQIYYNIIFEKSQLFCHFFEKLFLANLLYKPCCIMLFKPFFTGSGHLTLSKSPSRSSSLALVPCVLIFTGITWLGRSAFLAYVLISSCPIITGLYSFFWLCSLIILFKSLIQAL